MFNTDPKDTNWQRQANTETVNRDTLWTGLCSMIPFISQPA